MNPTVELKQPPVFKLAFWTAMFERFGFYILSFMLVLYLKDEFSMSDTQAFTLFGVVTALAFMLPAIGGYLGDNIFGIKRCMAIGLFIEGIGLSLLAVPNHLFVPPALALIVIGVGLFKTAPTNLLGRAYKEGDPRIDGGFTLYYMAMNIGSFASSILSGVIQRYYGWHVAFLMGGIGLFLGVLFYFGFRKTSLDLDSMVGQAKLSIKKWGIFIIGLILATIICSFLISYAPLADVFFAIVTITILCYFLYEIFKSSSEDKRKIIACLLLILIGMAYFIFYMQAYTSMTLFIDRNIARTIFGYTIPTEAYLGLNPVWVIILGPILAGFYKWTTKKFGKDLPVTLKFSIGLLVVSLCFFNLVASSHFANENAQVSSIWMVTAFGFYTLGEMLISALGVAMVAHIVPKRMYGITMGTWFIGMALAASMSGVLAGLANVPTGVTDPHTILNIYTNAFSKLGMGGLAVTIVVFIAGPFIKRMANLR